MISRRDFLKGIGAVVGATLLPKAKARGLQPDIVAGQYDEFQGKLNAAAAAFPSFDSWDFWWSTLTASSLDEDGLVAGYILGPVQWGGTITVNELPMGDSFGIGMPLEIEDGPFRMLGSACIQWVNFLPGGRYELEIAGKGPLSWEYSE